MKIKLSILLALSLFFTGCDLKDLSSPDSVLGKRDSTVTAKIAKWYNNHTAAIVITNDSGLSDSAEYKVIEYAYKKNVQINYEMVTSGFIGHPEIIKKIYDPFLKFGHGIYGHGHWHYNHDLLSYEKSYDSFYRCYKAMESLGLDVVTYAYPGGNGYKMRTRNALRDAGFLAGRYYDQIGHLDPYIVPGNETEPHDWYALPTLVMQDYGYDACDICINNTTELIPFLDETLNKQALLIITYHAIDQYDEYGFYDFENYKKDILAIAERDLWTAHFNDAVLYIYERKTAKAEVTWHFNENESPDKISVTVSDEYSDNEIFRQPLTTMFDVPLWWKDKTVSVYKNAKKLFDVKCDSVKFKISLPPDESTYLLKLKP